LFQSSAKGNSEQEAVPFHLRSSLRSLHSKQASQTAPALRLIVQTGREESLRFSRRSRSRSSFRSGSSRSFDRSSVVTAGAVNTAFRATITVTVDNLVATGFQSFFSLTTYTTVAVSQCTGQSRHDSRAAAAAVAAGCVTQFVSRFTANAFIRVIQTIHEGVDDLRVARAIVIAQFVQSIATLRGVAVGHRGVDQLGDLTRIFGRAAFAALITTAITARSSTAGVCTAGTSRSCTVRISSTASRGCTAGTSRSCTVRVSSTASRSCTAGTSRSCTVRVSSATGRSGTAGTSRSCTARIRCTAGRSGTADSRWSTAGNGRTARITAAAVITARWLDVGAFPLVRVHVRVTRTSNRRLTNSWLTVLSTAAALASAASEQAGFHRASHPRQRNCCTEHP